jgi:hypothetical protein
MLNSLGWDLYLKAAVVLNVGFFIWQSSYIEVPSNISRKKVKLLFFRNFQFGLLLLILDSAQDEL